MSDENCKCKCPETMYLPRGARVRIDNELKVTVRAATGYTYVGEKEGGGFINAGETTSISCQCVGEGSCAPFFVTGVNLMGCAGQCEFCIMEVNKFDSEQRILTGGYVDQTQIIDFLNDPEHTPLAFESMDSHRGLNRFLTLYMEDYPHLI